MLNTIIEWEEDNGYNPTFDALFWEWNNNRRDTGKIRPSTWGVYRDAYKRIDKGLTQTKAKRITLDQCTKVIEDMAATGCAYQSFAICKDIIINTLRQAQRKRLLQFSVNDLRDNLDISPRQFPKVHRKDCEEVFSEEETRMLIDYCIDNPSPAHYGLLLMIVTGMRVGELAALRPEDITADTVCIKRTETPYISSDGHKRVRVGDMPKTDSGYREIIVPMQFKWLLKRIKDDAEGREWCFVTFRGNRYPANCFRKALKEVCKALDIPYRSPHKIRKTYATALLDEKIDNRLIADQMGHSSINITEMYYHRDRRHIAEKERIISAVPDFNLSAPLETSTANA